MSFSEDTRMITMTMGGIEVYVLELKPPVRTKNGLNPWGPSVI